MTPMISLWFGNFFEPFYSDLLRRRNEGVVLPAPSEVFERPKVIYNRRTKQFVMWMHVDDSTYGRAETGVAVSDTPAGTYRFLGSFRPNGKESRDMTLFQDGDTAYLVHSSDWNSVIIIADLADNYLRPTGFFTRHFDHQHKNAGRESPALFKHAGKYFLITSGTTGWDPNPAEYAIAKTIHGPWRVKGKLCDSPTTFESQNTFVLPVNGQYIFLADRWGKDDLRDSRYVWLPLEVCGEELKLEWRDLWTLH